MHQRVSLIAAIDEKRGLGKNNDLLFKIPADMQRLRTLTTGHPLIMGRKTFESLGRLLPKRSHIVITRDAARLKHLSYKPDMIVSSLAEGLAQAKKFPGGEEIFIFGGGQVFTEAIEKRLAEKLYLTIVNGDYGADTFFPDYSPYTKVISSESHTSDGYEYRFVDLER